MYVLLDTCRRKTGPVHCLAVILVFCLGLWVTDGKAAEAADQQGMESGARSTHAAELGPSFVLAAVGDSLTHGTMSATNNLLNSVNGYLQRIALSLSRRLNLHFRQPFFDVQENRIRPFVVPTNLGVDGADAFSVEGLEYYKRAGTDRSLLSLDLLAEKRLPTELEDKYDKVLYPTNLLAGKTVSQMGAADWLLTQGAPTTGIEKSLFVFWVGNNEASVAALGLGGNNPEFFPVPLDEIADEISPILRWLMEFGREAGVVSFEPYTQAAIERNLTGLQDFEAQFNRLINRLALANALSPVEVDFLVLTLPYYTAVGYLFDSEDLEFYFQKLDPAYSVPPSFQRVAEPGEPIENPLQGDRISLLTFGLMYALLATGHSVEEVNRVLEKDGVQEDGLVLSEAEQQFVTARIDSYNDIIRDAVVSRGPNFHLIEIGEFLNDGLLGELEIIVNGDRLNRKWARGGVFSLDGVHPGNTGQSLIANFVLEHLNAEFGFDAPLYDVSDVYLTDPYVDQDKDGWVPGPGYEAPGLGKLLFLFTDPDDTDPGTGAELPPDVWDLISQAILEELLGITAIRAEADRLGVVSAE